MGSGVFNEVWPSAKTISGNRVLLRTEQGLEPQNRTTRGSNRRDTKEGCAERIARCGTLSQNGYGDDESALAGADEAVCSAQNTARLGFEPNYSPWGNTCLVVEADHPFTRVIGTVVREDLHRLLNTIPHFGLPHASELAAGHVWDPPGSQG